MAVLEKNPFAQFLLEKGRQEGLQEGEEQAKKSICLKLSESGHSVAEIAELLGATEEQVRHWLSLHS